ncbi:hypothetical protein HZS_7103 [Henneguya salminicola]|nr:hypothetical protein HZS_7103 [Henneguya salminicola]
MFENDSVARIASSHVVKPERNHNGLFSGYTIPEKYYYQPWEARDAIKASNLAKSKSKNPNQPIDVERHRREEACFNAKLKEMGINYSFTSEPIIDTNLHKQ